MLLALLCVLGCDKQLFYWCEVQNSFILLLIKCNLWSDIYFSFILLSIWPSFNATAFFPIQDTTYLTVPMPKASNHNMNPHNLSVRCWRNDEPKENQEQHQSQIDSAIAIFKHCTRQNGKIDINGKQGVNKDVLLIRVMNAYFPTTDSGHSFQIAALFHWLTYFVFSIFTNLYLPPFLLGFADLKVRKQWQIEQCLRHILHGTKQ